MVGNEQIREIKNVADWRPERENFVKIANSGGIKKRRRYIDHICAFDIETTRIEEIEQSVMYIWQFCIDAETVIIGRTWAEFITLLDKIRSLLTDKQTLVIYVHNLSYEFQFLRAIYNFSKEEVFCVKSRKVLKCCMYDEKIEFRCSYIQTNMSLGEFTAKMGARHAKLSGAEFDYDKKRYSWTAMSEKEMQYCYNDVIGLCEALKIEMDRDGDTLYTIPLTSTGYVRRDAKKAMSGLPHSAYKIDEEIYTALSEAIRGGNTHANRYYSGYIIENVKSADRSSSYPDVQCNLRFPCGEFYKVKIKNEEDINNRIKHGKSLLMRLCFYNISLANDLWGCPYLTSDKGRNIINEELDNGRILSADQYETTVTDVDYGIIKEEYVYDDIEIIDAWQNNYCYLPRNLVNTIIDYYKKKTELKGVEGADLMYLLAKQKLNGIYGMSAQNPIKQQILFSESGHENIFGALENYFLDNKGMAEMLATYNKKVWLPYAWGVWTTAHARRMLEDGIRLAGDNFIYCDTDSVKYIGDIDFSAYNNERIKASKRSGAYATDPKGVTHYMGVFEQEKSYDRFITLGAKKYAYEQDGKIGITVAGVSKKDGAKELGCLENFRPDFEFKLAGGLESVYNDKAYGNYCVDGRDIYIGQNICLRPSTYKIGLSDDYSLLLSRVTYDLQFRADLEEYIYKCRDSKRRRGQREQKREETTNEEHR